MRQLWDIIATIFRISWRALNFIREFVFNAIFLVLFFVVIGSIAFYQTETQPEKLFWCFVCGFTGVIVDQVSTPDPFGRMSRELLGTSNSRMQENSLFDIVDTIRTAANDDRIT